MELQLYSSEVDLSQRGERKITVTQLKPVSLDVFAEARDEAHVVLAHLMARLAPGEHVVRLGVGMDGQKPLSAVLPVTVEGDGGSDDMVGVEPKYFDNFAFLLACGLAQKVCWGVMYLRSPATEQGDQAYTVRAWDLTWGALTECDAARAAELIGDREPAAFEDAFGVHSSNDGDEAVYPPVAYTVL
ncbi:hypothetical protein [Streptomyces sp. NPDC056468]|uniref:hypothetical protein n=1 Tax=Streptomyces sp. NPDC056468 TaxID=3345830 RepID=UPI003691B8AD